MNKNSMYAARGFRMTPAERAKGRLMRSPDGHPEGEQSAETKAAVEAAAARAEAAAAAKTTDAGPTADEIAALRDELAAAKSAAAKFDGIDPEIAKANARKVAEAETAARTAEAEKAKAEGNFERLRELQNEEHLAALANIQSERDAARTEAAQAIADAALARRSAAFASSKFFATETILSPVKAERIYGDHVEVENGFAVVYDAPKGAPKRAIVMDTKGKPLPFDDAMKKVVEGEPDKDTFLKSKITPGGGSKTVDGKVNAAPKDRLSKLSAGVAKLRS